MHLPLTLNFTLTFDDHREATAAVAPLAHVKSPRFLRSRFVVWLLAAFLLFSFTAFLLGPPGDPDARQRWRDSNLTLFAAFPSMFCMAVTFYYAFDLAYRGRIPSPSRNLFLVLLGLLPLLAYAFWKWLDPARGSPFTLGLFLPAILLLSFASTPRTAYKRWAAHPSSKTPRTVNLHNAGVQISAGPVHSDCAWSAFQRFHETPNLFLLQSAPRTVEILPKRAFPTEADIDEFRSFLSDTLDDTPPDDNGFPAED